MGLFTTGIEILWCTIQGIVGLLIILIGIPIVFPFGILLWVWRWVVVTIIRLRSGVSVQVASGMDAIFALDQSEGRSICSGVAILKGQLDIKRVRQFISERITDVKDRKNRFLHPKLRQTVEVRGGVVVWMDVEDFKIENHVQELTEGNQPICFQNEEDLVNLMGCRANKPFPSGQSQWEFVIAPLKHYGRYVKTGEPMWNHTAVIIRAHHAIGDGRSMVGLFIWNLMDPVIPRPLPSYRHSSRSKIAYILRLLWSFTHLPWVIFRAYNRGKRSSLHGVKMSGEKYIIWSPPLSLASLKEGKPLFGVSVNDLILTGLSAALQRFFDEEKASKSEPSKLLTGIPVDITVPGIPLSLSNKIALCPLWVPTTKLPPRKRLKFIHKQTCQLKSSPDLLLDYLIFDLIGNFFPSGIARWLFSSRGITLFASNMSGPTEQINLFGHLIDDIMFWIPTSNKTGLGLSILSYNGSLRLGLITDCALIPEREVAERFMKNMAEETKNILKNLKNTEERKIDVV